MKKLILAVTIILSPLFHNTAFGCSCPTVGTMNPTFGQIESARLRDFESAVAVFSGEVIELEPNKATFKVEKIWKGELVDEIVMVIQLKKDSGVYVRTSCNYHYVLGEKYLVYAYGASDELNAHGCTRTTGFKNVERFEEEMKGLNKIKLPDVRNIKPTGKSKN
ncbi:MAG: hypothetical protein M3Q99_12075 [Acidobacteriota bacterium]|nr:hypothetical protein [Acidobacteriota bacterium]